MTAGELPLQLEQNNGDRLMDLAVHIGVIRFIALRAVDRKTVARIARVCIEGKLGKRQKVDPVPVFNG